jgi:glycosyltransferase involved in cell wall biosynthesis
MDVGYPVQGGSQITFMTFLQKLAARGHECVYLDQARTAWHGTRGSVQYAVFRDFHELNAQVKRHRPDVLIAAHCVLHQAVKLGLHLGIPVLGYLNSFEYCPPTAAEKRRWQLSLEKPYPTRAEREFALRGATRMLVNSEFLRDRLERLEGTESEVIYPALDRSDYLLDERREGHYVTGICGFRHKGAEIFLELARRFPRQLFLLVGPMEHRHYAAVKALPNVRVQPFCPPRTFLRRSRVVLVPSQWAEPFGRIAVEAMASGIPTLASRTGGLAEIVGDSPLGVSAFRNVEAWQRKLGPLLDSAEARRRGGEHGRSLAARFLCDKSVERLDVLVREVGASAQPTSSARPTAALRGRADAQTAYERVNREWLVRLNERGRYAVASVPSAKTFCALPLDVVIHHDFGEPFESLVVPNEGALVAVRTWDFGPLPPAWVAKINHECDRLWVYSTWVKRQAIAAGVEPSKVRVVPLGVDERVFHPDGPHLPLPTDRTFRFLFAGATVRRKGIDVLLRAYGEAFGPHDDVCLVIKDRPGDVFYRGIDFRREIEHLARDPTFPALVYLRADLAVEEMAALYRACDVGAFPYRAEGFALPILEMMACGRPSIVPRFGASLDYCSPATAFQLAVTRINLPVRGRLAFNTLGFEADLDEVDFCEVSPARLAETMRAVRELPRGSIQRKGASAAALARERFTWDRSVEQVERELASLARREVPARIARHRAARVHEARVFAAARTLYAERMMPGIAASRRGTGR